MLDRHITPRGLSDRDYFRPTSPDSSDSGKQFFSLSFYLIIKIWIRTNAIVLHYGNWSKHPIRGWAWNISTTQDFSKIFSRVWKKHFFSSTFFFQEGGSFIFSYCNNEFFYQNNQQKAIINLMHNTHSFLYRFPPISLMIFFQFNSCFYWIKRC